MVLDLFEAVSGQRLTYSVMRIGELGPGCSGGNMI